GDSSTMTDKKVDGVDDQPSNSSTKTNTASAKSSSAHYSHSHLHLQATPGAPIASSYGGAGAGTLGAHLQPFPQQQAWVTPEQLAEIWGVELKHVLDSIERGSIKV